MLESIYYFDNVYYNFNSFYILNISKKLYVIDSLFIINFQSIDKLKIEIKEFNDDILLNSDFFKIKKLNFLDFIKRIFIIEDIKNIKNYNNINLSFFYKENTIIEYVDIKNTINKEVRKQKLKNINV
jgi:hypothetical protein